jgi:hypothetical protein
MPLVTLVMPTRRKPGPAVPRPGRCGGRRCSGVVDAARWFWWTAACRSGKLGQQVRYDRLRPTTPVGWAGPTRGTPTWHRSTSFEDSGPGRGSLW